MRQTNQFPRRCSPENDIESQYNDVLRELKEIRDEFGKYDPQELKTLLENVEKQVDNALKGCQEEINHLKDEIQDLKHKIEELQNYNSELDASVALAQATWEWEAHVARFVVDHRTDIGEYRRFGQMNDYLDDREEEDDDRWYEIQSKIFKWTQRHWDVVNSVRAERNGIARPQLIDLDLAQQKITQMTRTDQLRMKNMLDMLKMTASLMKFGRLALNAELPQKLSADEKEALENITLWNRNFEQIGGLQNIEHEEAKEYLQMYVGKSHPKLNNYFSVVDSIKEANGKRLGKLANDFDELNRRKESSEALEKLKKLLPKNHGSVTVLRSSIAKLHIADFLPKHLWKDGIEIVEGYAK